MKSPARGGSDVPVIAAANRTRLPILIVAGLICLAPIGLGQPAGAAESTFRDWAHHSDVYGALVEYAQSVGLANSQSIEPQEPRLASADGAGFHGAASRDPDYAALADFVRQIPGGQSGLGEAPSADVEPLLGLDHPAPAAEPRLVVAQKAAPKRVTTKAPDDATLVGSQTCLKCHASQAATFERTLMGKYGKVKKGTMDCENCHGPGSAHVKAGGGRGVGGIISFRSDDPTRGAAEHNAICLTCHDKGNRALWQGSTHEMRDVACTNCHTVMKNVTLKFQLAKPTEQATCFQCHKNKRAEIWRSSHMPIREGKVKCTDCHNPHGSFSEALLKEASVNDTCYQCHAEKRGPFLWEHAPVRENCLNCHDPHGSINDFMLKISRPRLCQQCHSTLTGHPGNPRNPLSIFAINRECQNCHSQHHGSNSPSGPRFHR